MALEAAVVATKRRRVALFLRMLRRCLCGPQGPRTCCSTAQPLPTRLLPLRAAASRLGPCVLTCAEAFGQLLISPEKPTWQHCPFAQPRFLNRPTNS